MTPIYDTLQDYLSKSPIRMHVPFHNGISNNAIFPKGLYDLDISEVSGYDVEGEDNPLFQSEKITANLFNMSHSFYLTGGASQGLLASMLALRKYGKKVIIARNSHKSVINGIVLAGLEPLWLEVDFLNEWGIFSRISLEKLEKLINENTDIAGCLIVSPTYEGIISEVKAIAEMCHKKNIPLVVDEAHGGHLRFTSVETPRWDTPTADLIIQSWHKSLGSLTQTGVLHLSNNNFFSYEDIKKCLDLISSTSPSFLLLLSLELTRKHLAETKGEYFKGLFINSSSFKEGLKAIENICILDNDDPLKIYIKHRFISGIDFAYELYKNHAIEIESANDIGFLMIIGISFNEDIMKKTLSACKDVACNVFPKQKTLPACNVSTAASLNIIASPRKAFFEGLSAYGGKNKNLEYECEVKAPCPPGYAISIPGIKKQ